MDYVASVFILIGVWFITEKKPIGFWIMIIGEICYIIFAISIASWALLGMNMIFFMLDIKGIVSWNKDNNKRNKNERKRIRRKSKKINK